MHRGLRSLLLHQWILGCFPQGCMIHPMDTWSQFGEDVLIWEFFGQSKDGVFLEVGAHHPTKISQTYLLETQGWKGVLIEPQPRLAALLRDNRPGSVVFEFAVVGPGKTGDAYLVIPACSEAAAYITFEKPVALPVPARVELVKTSTIDSLLRRSGFDRVDLLSIDIEGLELEALRGFSFEKYHPRLVLIEDHLETLDKHRLLVANHYRLVDRTGYNHWYVPLNHPFPLRPRTGRLELFRKMYLSHPFRKLRALLKPKNRPAASGDAA